ncbi:MAG: DUF1559 domain-containing protein [Mariniblastus sp.]
MAIPAVQSVREGARVTACKNNLRQLATATISYESANRRLPPGTLGFEGAIISSFSDFPTTQNDANFKYYLGKNQNTSWIAQLLGFLELSPLSDQLPSICTDSKSDLTNSTFFPSGLYAFSEVQVVMETPISVVECPSDSLAVALKNPVGSQPVYATDEQIDVFFYLIVEEFPMAGTNYAGCSGAYSGGKIPVIDMLRYDGVFGSRSKTRLADVRDGTSNTILIGESSGHIIGRERQSQNPWLFAALARGRSDLDWRTQSSIRSPGLELLGDSWFAHQTGFASMHPTSVNFAHVDGSVHAVNRAIDWQTLYSLCGMKDGE